ncbi:MAG: PAP2 family protein [Deferribacteres bacterium]|nr:PAP2 family protein [candidate division KSB1 bacterium]MCB9503397.1 PAP2 family protein [Deferribacteres bacterium]
MKKLPRLICMLGFLVLFLLQNSYSQNIKKIKKTGDYVQIALPLTALASTYVKTDATLRKQYFESFAATLFVTYVGKLTVPTLRPDGSDSYSWISGHTAASVFGAAFMEKHFGLKIGIPAYIAAGFVGWSRVKSKKHSAGDVLRGAIAGAFFPHWDLAKLHKTIKIKATNIENGIGLNLELSW